MTIPSERDLYVARALRVSAAAERFGVTLSKVPGKHELEISGAAGSVVFPIVTDDQTWLETTESDALYVVLLDARGWSSIRVEDTPPAGMDDVERTELPQIRQDLSSEMIRIERLATVLGGRANLDALWETAELVAA